MTSPTAPPSDAAGLACPATPAQSTLITLNGQALSLAPGCTLAQLLQAHAVAPESVATAVNGQFVARSARATRVLTAGDAVTTFQAIVGG